MSTKVSNLLHDCLRAGINRLEHDCVADLKMFVRKAYDPERRLFFDRYGHGDVYYSAFGFALARVLGLRLPFPVIDKTNLNFVHFRSACLLENMQFWSRYLGRSRQRREITRYYEVAPKEWFPQGDKTSLYSQFLLFSMLEDCGGALPEIVLKKPETLTALTALVLLQKMKRQRVDAGLLDEIRSLQQPDGGFLPYHGAAKADLLSGSLAAFALKTQKLSPIYPMADFLDRHFVPGVSFVGSDCPGDELSDVEYTFYGVLNAAL